MLDRIANKHKVLSIDFTAVPFIDSTAVHFIYELAHKTSGRNVALVLTGVESVERLLGRESGVSSL